MDGLMCFNFLQKKSQSIISNSHIQGRWLIFVGQQNLPHEILSLMVNIPCLEWSRNTVHQDVDNGQVLKSGQYYSLEELCALKTYNDPLAPVIYFHHIFCIPPNYCLQIGIMTM